MKRWAEDPDHPDVLSILLGRHGYGMSPELETQWARAFLLNGLALGILIGMFIAISLKL